MALRSLVYYPHPVLLTPTKPIEKFDAEFQQLVDDMIETMRHEDGVGLAANQIGLPYQLAVIDAERSAGSVLVIVNPEIIASKGEWKTPEGCLSIPHVYETVPRASEVTVRFLDRHGKPQEMVVKDRLAHVFQHECDHLNGKVYIQRLSPVKRQLIEKKLRKHKK